MAGTRHPLLEEAAVWAEANRQLLEAAYRRFLGSGEWPELESLQREFELAGADIDIRSVVSEMPRALGFPEGDRLVLLVRGLSFLPEADSVLKGWRAALVLAYELWCQQEDAQLSETDVEELLGDQQTADRVGKLLLRESWPFGSGGANQLGRWYRDIHSSVRAARDARSPEQIIAARDAIEFPLPDPARGARDPAKAGLRRARAVWNAISTHPLWSTLIAGLMLLALGALLQLDGDTEDKPGSAGDTTIGVNGGDNSGKDACIVGGVYIQSNVECEREANGAPEPMAATADAGCGTVGGRTSRRRVRLAVLMWCAPKGVRGQYQYKLKVSVKNTGNATLDIRRNRFFLVWRTLNPDRWSPPPGRGPAPPRRLTVAGREVWGISANPDGAAETIPSSGTPTFATHWSHTQLLPGEKSLQPRPDARELRYSRGGRLKVIRFNYHEDDLVFYVPASAVNRDRNFLGLAYHDGRRVMPCVLSGNGGRKCPLTRSEIGGSA